MASDHRFSQCAQIWRRRPTVWVSTPASLILLISLSLLSAVQPTAAQSPAVSPSQIPRPMLGSAGLGLSKQQCDDANREWLTRYTATGISLPSYGKSISLICRTGGQASCCSANTENQMFLLSKKRVHNLLADWIRKPMYHMGNDSVGLSYYFKSNLDLSRKSLHEMFSSTYGYNYKQNRQFFVDFYNDLQDYMAGNQEDISRRIDRFFDDLRLRIVHLIENAKTTGDYERSKCMSERLKTMQPFEKMPETIKNRVLKSYPSSRTLVNALRVGQEILASLANGSLISEDCARAHVLMKDCHFCAGVSRARPCQGLCTNVFNGCFYQYSYLSQSWVKFTDSLTQVISRLESHHNFPNVNHALKVQISSAMMSLQTLIVSSKVKLHQECGAGMPALNGNNSPAFGRQPSARSRRRRRQASQELLKHQWTANGMPSRTNQIPPPQSNNRPRSGFQTESTVDKLTPWARKMKETYHNFRNLFNDMASQMCLDPINRYQTLSASPCWNGTDNGSPNYPVVRSTPSEQTQNPLFKMTSTQISPGVQQALSRLDQMSERLLKTLTDQEALYLPLLNPNPVGSPFTVPGVDGRPGLGPSTDDDGSLPSGSGGGPLLPFPEILPPKTKPPKVDRKKNQPLPQPTIKNPIEQPRVPIVDLGSGDGQGPQPPQTGVDLVNPPFDPKAPVKPFPGGIRPSPDFGSGQGKIPPFGGPVIKNDDEDVFPPVSGGEGSGSGVNKGPPDLTGSGDGKPPPIQPPTDHGGGGSNGGDGGVDEDGNPNMKGENGAPPSGNGGKGFWDNIPTKIWIPKGERDDDEPPYKSITVDPRLDRTTPSSACRPSISSLASTGLVTSLIWILANLR